MKTGHSKNSVPEPFNQSVLSQALYFFFLNFTLASMACVFAILSLWVMQAVEPIHFALFPASVLVCFLVSVMQAFSLSIKQKVVK